MKKSTSIFIALMLMLVVACNNNATEQSNTTDSTEVKTDSTTAGNVEATIVTFATLTDSAALALNGKVVKIKGTVDHVCKHGGKRMVIVGTQPNERMRVEAGENPPFDAELAGAEVEVIGTLHIEKIDSTYLAEWEADLKEKANEGVEETEKKHIEGAHVEGEEHEGEHEGEASIEQQLQQIQKLKQVIANNGTGYIVTKYMELIEYKKLD